MGTLNREKREYSWSAGGVNYVVALDLMPVDGLCAELYRLACEDEVQDRIIQAHRDTIASQSEKIAGGSRLIADLRQGMVDAAKEMRDDQFRLSNQAGTIKSLREQLLAANAQVRSLLDPNQFTEVPADSLGRSRLSTRQAFEKLDNHESRLSLHEARLDAMEEVFDKIKDIL